MGKNMFINLRDMAVLAKTAGQVASEATDGKYGTAGEKMVERFLLHRIRRDGRKNTEALGNEPAIPVHTGFANAVLAWPENTPVRT